MPIEYNPSYLHHIEKGRVRSVRELVFGMEDGMVSTLGAITGIAAATGNHFTVVLAGFIIIAVESISMAVGAYLSSKSVRAIEDRKLSEESEELEKFPEEEKKELIEMYVRDGWSPLFAKQMTDEAARNQKLFLQEMAYRELSIIPDHKEEPGKNGAVMLVSYLVGGAIPLLPYLAFTITPALQISIIITFVALFGLGVFSTRYSKRVWWKAGLEMLLLAGLAAVVGYAVGQVGEGIFN